MALQLAAHQQIEFLVGAAQLDVGLQRHRVIALRNGIQQLMHRNRLLFHEALVEVLALQHLRDRELRRQPDEAFVAQLVEPLAVEAHLGFVPIENLEDLRLIGLGVLIDLLARQRRPRGRAPRRVADQPGEIADKEDDRVAHVLKVFQLAHEHGVAQVQVGRGRVEAGLHPHGLARRARLLQPLAQVAFTNDLRRALAQVSQLLFNLGK